MTNPKGKNQGEGDKESDKRYRERTEKFVNSPEGKRLHLRGINARVVQGGAIRVGDIISKV